MTIWRFIDSGPLDGCSNMAIDEALLRCFNPESSMPVFRIYGWDPPALSLGRFQKAWEVLDRQKCLESGAAVVRRITGGGVIYHADELTYAIVCSPDDISPAVSIKESFRVLTSFLIGFYKRLGLDPSYVIDSMPETPGTTERTPFCFAGRESYDILINERKIGGNAQRRLKNAIFQHGSIPLINRAWFGATLLREPPDGIEERTTSLFDLGVGKNREELRTLMIESFEESMPAVIRESSLTLEESGLADSLGREKHSAESWVWQGIERLQ